MVATGFFDCQLLRYLCIHFFISEEKLDKLGVGKGWWNADKDLLVIPVPPHVVRGRVGIPGVVEQVHSKSGAFRHIAVTVTV